jgi:hypothetical protein
MYAIKAYVVAVFFAFIYSQQLLPLASVNCLHISLLGVCEVIHRQLFNPVNIHP